jgi:hypothetical protein
MSARRPVTVRIESEGVDKTFVQHVDADLPVEKAVELAVMEVFLAVRVDDSGAEHRDLGG